MINVTKPFLPPKEDYLALVDEIWKRNWLTNNGPLVNELELQLKSYLGLEHLLFLSNGTIALQIAIKALKLKGDIITTPFSYVATTSSIVWENCNPVFVDIDEKSLNINPSLIESAITKNTSAILATHVYGNPCDIDAIEKVAKEHNLKVIYDAAHCFGTTYKGKSVFEYGDISTASFHATKLFHTIEGGAVFTKSPELTNIMAKLRNFGHEGPESFSHVGINGKNSEFHAAMGLANLKQIDSILSKRKEQQFLYFKKLENLDIRFVELNNKSSFNYAYLPIIFPTEEILLEAVEALNNQYVYPRRYFYPSLNTLHYVNNVPCPVSEDISKRVLTLPLFHDLSNATIDMICRVLLRNQNTRL
jgi:dTDP-4-amino-4,6-dideoxygalactose transaminase